jgi:hypothetical protein
VLPVLKIPINFKVICKSLLQYMVPTHRSHPHRSTE